MDITIALRHNGRDAVPIHQPHECIFKRVYIQITSLTSVYSGTDQRKHQSSLSLAFVRGIHRWPMNSPHKGPVTRKLFLFDDVIMTLKDFPPDPAGNKTALVKVVTSSIRWQTIA